MIYLIIFLIFFMVLLMIYGFLYSFFEGRIKILERINYIETIEEEKAHKDEDKSTFYERMIQPLYQSLGNYILKFTPAYKQNELSRNLEKAGLLKKQNAESWIMNKTLITIGITFLIGLIFYTIEPSLVKALFLSVLIFMVIQIIFRFLLSKKITTRKETMARELPYTIDLITVSVEAGLSFDGAIGRVVQNIRGDLCDEFSKTLKEMRMGIDRKTALKNMRDRCDIKELSMLLTSLIQADELGVSLGNVLRIESAQLREHRKQLAREKAMKAPIKMLFPLIFFIFPAIFVIILGPALIQIFSIFGG